MTKLILSSYVWVDPFQFHVGGGSCGKEGNASVFLFSISSDEFRNPFVKLPDDEAVKANGPDTVVDRLEADPLA